MVLLYLSLVTLIRLALVSYLCFFFFQAEDGIRDDLVTGVQTCALPISRTSRGFSPPASASINITARTDWGRIHWSRAFLEDSSPGRMLSAMRAASRPLQIGRASCRERV